MKQLIAISLVLTTMLSSANSGDHSPRLYYNRFHKELNNFQVRSMDYYIANLTDADDRVIESKRQKIVSQLNLSRSRVQSAPVFKGNSNFRDSYLAGIDSLKQIHETEFVEVFRLKKYRNQSYEQLLAYYKAQNAAEKKVQKQEEYLMQMEQKFATRNNISLEVYTKKDKQYQIFTSINSHYRNLNLLFSRVNHSVEKYLEIVKTHPHSNLDQLGLQGQLDELRQETNAALEILENQNDESSLDPELKDDLLAYLKNVKIKSKKSLIDITLTFEEQPYYTNEFRDAQIDLVFFIENYNSSRMKFLKSQKLWIANSFDTMQNTVAEL